MRWLMNIHEDIWNQDSNAPLLMIETDSSEIPDASEFMKGQYVRLDFPVEKTINDINKEMIESELENQQPSNTKPKGDRE